MISVFYAECFTCISLLLQDTGKSEHVETDRRQMKSAVNAFRVITETN